MTTSFQRPANSNREDKLVSTCKSWTNADSYFIAVYISISAAPCTEGRGRRRKGLGRRREGAREGEEGTGDTTGRGKGAARPLHLRCSSNDYPF